MRTVPHASQSITGFSSARLGLELGAPRLGKGNAKSSERTPHRRYGRFSDEQCCTGRLLGALSSADPAANAQPHAYVRGAPSAAPTSADIASAVTTTRAVSEAVSRSSRLPLSDRSVVGSLSCGDCPAGAWGLRGAAGRLMRRSPARAPS